MGAVVSARYVPRVGDRVLMAPGVVVDIRADLRHGVIVRSDDGLLVHYASAESLRPEHACTCGAPGAPRDGQAEAEDARAAPRAPGSHPGAAPVGAWPCIGSRFTSREMIARESAERSGT